MQSGGRAKEELRFRQPVIEAQAAQLQAFQGEWGVGPPRNAPVGQAFRTELEDWLHPGGGPDGERLARDLERRAVERAVAADLDSVARSGRCDSRRQGRIPLGRVTAMLEESEGELARIDQPTLIVPR